MVGREERQGKRESAYEREGERRARETRMEFLPSL